MTAAVVSNRTERIRTHLTPALLRLDAYQRSGDPKHIRLIVEALGRALTAAVEERVRADEREDRRAAQAATERGQISNARGK